MRVVIAKDTGLSFNHWRFYSLLDTLYSENKECTCEYVMLYSQLQKEKKERKGNKLSFLNGTERCNFGENCFISYLMILFSIFSCSFLHTSYLKPASQRPLFRLFWKVWMCSGWSVDRDIFLPSCSAGHCGS